MPAAPAGRLWLLRDQLVEQRWLLNLVVVVLVLHVSAYDVFIDADRGDEVSPCPQRLFFVESVGPLDLFLHPCGRLALQYLHDVRDRVPWRGENAEVDVVILDAEFDDLPVLPFADRFEDPLQFAFDLLCNQNLPPILGRPYQVVFEVVETV